MLQNLLTSSPWLWGGLIASMLALPILIHFINQLRYRRIRFAAIDFLLASHRRNQRKVWIKQWLLVAARIVALLLILFSVAQVGCEQNRLTSWLGGSVIHHYVLLDDSYSMGEKDGDQSAFDRCKETLRVLASQLSVKNGQRISLVRFSQAQIAARSDEIREPGAENNFPVLDVNGQVIDRGFESQLESLLGRITVSSMSCGPHDAIELANRLIQQPVGETPVVYVLSDFRKKDWGQATSAVTSLDGLRRSGASIELVRTTEYCSANLAIVDLAIDSSVRVASVPIMMTISIRNFSAETIRNIQVRLQSASYSESESTGAAPDLVRVTPTDLPMLLVENVEPGETVTQRFSVYFAQPGQHAVFAKLPDDAMDSDNERFVVLPVKAQARVLVVGNSTDDDTSIVSLALNPGNMTGIATVPATAAALRDATEQELAECDAIFLLGVERLEEAAANRLYDYVSAGGGVVFFTGPSVDVNAWNDVLYKNGNGIFPVALDSAVEIPVDSDETTVDIQSERHPVWSHVLDVKNSPLALVQVREVLRPALEWSAETDNVQVLATVRGDSTMPLMVEKKIGKGTVLAVLTSAGPLWNNWCRNGTFPASLLLMQEYVGRNRNETAFHQIGNAIVKTRRNPNVASEYAIVVPGSVASDRVVWPKGSAGKIGNPSSSDFVEVAANESTQPGVYEIWQPDEAGVMQVERIAVNVDTRESEPELLNAGELNGLASGATDRVTSANEFMPGAKLNQNSNLTRLLFFVVLLVLVAEHFLASANSYH